MKEIIIFIFFLIVATGCNVSDSLTEITTDAKIPEDLLITLERTGCFATVNTCPTYILTVKSDGTLEFEGKEVTSVKGKVKDKISEEKIKRIIEEFQKADYFNLENSYDYDNCPAFATDQPDVKTSIQINGKKKSVRHNLGCRDKSSAIFPTHLTELENKLDEIVETKRWIGERK